MSDGGLYARHSEKELARQAEHDVGAFAELYRRNLSRVYGYLLARTGNVQDAQDLTSQTFLTALEQIGTYRGEGSVIAWLLSVARHKLGDHFRRRKPTLALEAALDLADETASPEDQTGQQLRLERVTLALQALSPDRAEALALRIFGRLSVAEVASSMSKSEAAVRMLIHRGLRDLQGRLAPIMEVEDE